MEHAFKSNNIHIHRHSQKSYCIKMGGWPFKHTNHMSHMRNTRLLK